MSTFVNWVIDTLAREDVVDLYFVLTDLVEVNITEAERCETAFYDAMAMDTANNHSNGAPIPLGKLVL